MKDNELMSKFLKPTGDVWGPGVDEPAYYYYAFKHFLDLGPSRTLPAVASFTGQSPTAVRSAAKRFSWVERASAYDQHLIDLEFKARDCAVVDGAIDFEARRSTLREQAFSLHQQLVARAQEMLQAPLYEEVEDQIEEVDPNTGLPMVVRRVTRIPTKWSIRDAARLAATADNLGRLALEMPTSYQKITVVQKKIQLTMRMVVGLMSKGLTPQQVRERLVAVQVEENEVDEAIRLVLEDQSPDGASIKLVGNGERT